MMREHSISLSLEFFIFIFFEVFVKIIFFLRLVLCEFVLVWMGDEDSFFSPVLELLVCVCYCVSFGLFDFLNSGL